MPRASGALRLLCLLLAVAATKTGHARADVSGDSTTREFLAAHPIWRVSADPSWRPYSMWTVHCVVVSQHGSLRLASALGKGTMVTIELPLAAGANSLASGTPAT